MNNKIVRFLIISFLWSVSAFADDDQRHLLTVLNTDEPAPPAAALVSRQSFTGNNPAGDCAYYELVESAKGTARSLGANVMKINTHRKRTREQYCDEIGVAFYKVADISQYETRFSWTADRLLSWQDFKGGVPGNAAANTAAVTSCGIAIETNTATDENPVKVYVSNSFETNTSWVRPGQQKPEVLQHEQGHFDLCELYTRLMRERFGKAQITVRNLQQAVRDIYGTTMREYAARQQQYEQDTRHGLVDAEQQRWAEMIAAELRSTAIWASK